MPLQATSGAASYDAFGGGVPVVPNYIEDVMSTWVYDGTGASLTITNGIDLSTKGGMVWIKQRTSDTDPVIFDTLRGAGYVIQTNDPGAQYLSSTTLTGFTTSGFSLGNSGPVNASSASNKYVSWSFRKAPKFFDVVTWTGSGSNREISHALGSVPACIIVKQISSGDNAWQVYHRSLANTEYLVLNTTAAKATGTTRWNSTTPTSTVFSLGTDATVNASGGTYVAYVFAHDAGGFGLTGTDNVISCGSFTTNGTGNATVSLGYEPQWVLVKNTSAVEDWLLIDSMRGWVVGGNSRYLRPNLANAEPGTALGNPTATGFDFTFSASATYIYIAIRRGPMKVPTSGTSVFSPIAVTNSAGTDNTTNFPVDLQINSLRSASDKFAVDRLRGVSSTATNIGSQLITNSTATEAGSGSGSITRNWSNTGFQTSDEYGSLSTIYWNFRRAPSFFDVVCYTGTGVDLTVNHNLGVVPEWVIIKNRSRAGTNWSGAYFANASEYYDLRINQDIGRSLITMGPLGPTLISNSATTFGVYGGSTLVNYSGDTYVAYLFATCAGVSKCTSFTGTGTLQTIDCGFTSGSRFVLIKRTDSTGDWYVWDSSRGLSSSTDPYLLLNSTAAEVTSTNWVDTTSTGFQVTAASGNNVNINGASYIALAIA